MSKNTNNNKQVVNIILHEYKKKRRRRKQANQPNKASQPTIVNNVMPSQPMSQYDMLQKYYDNRSRSSIVNELKAQQSEIQEMFNTAQERGDIQQSELLNQMRQMLQNEIRQFEPNVPHNQTAGSYPDNDDDDVEEYETLGLIDDIKAMSSQLSYDDWNWNLTPQDRNLFQQIRQGSYANLPSKSKVESLYKILEGILLGKDMKDYPNQYNSQLVDRNEISSEYGSSNGFDYEKYMFEDDDKEKEESLSGDETSTYLAASKASNVKEGSLPGREPYSAFGDEASKEVAKAATIKNPVEEAENEVAESSKNDKDIDLRLTPDEFFYDKEKDELTNSIELFTGKTDFSDMDKKDRKIIKDFINKMSDKITDKLESDKLRNDFTSTMTKLKKGKDYKKRLDLIQKYMSDDNILYK